MQLLGSGYATYTHTHTHTHTRSSNVSKRRVSTEKHSVTFKRYTHKHTHLVRVQAHTTHDIREDQAQVEDNPSVPKSSGPSN